MSNRITDKDSLKIRTLVSTGMFTPQEVASYFDEKFNADQIIRHIKTKAPSLRDKFKRETSRGAVKLRSILTRIFPNVTIHDEFHVGEKLRLDFYIAEPYNLGFEFDGIQHKKYTPGFHKDEFAFADAQAKDVRKEELCVGRGISLVRIAHDEDLDTELVQVKIEEIGHGSGSIKKGYETFKEVYTEKQKVYDEKATASKKEYQKQYKESDSYKAAQAKQKDYRKQQYQKQKEWRKANKKQ